VVVGGASGGGAASVTTATAGSRGDATDQVATGIFERDFERWGLLAFTQLAGKALKLVRKGVGAVASLKRPRYALGEADPQYFSKARDAPDDYIKRRCVLASSVWICFLIPSVSICVSVWIGVYFRRFLFPSWSISNSM
jgi:hypothetical protein